MVESNPQATTGGGPQGEYPFEKMLDPLGDRVMKDVPCPPRYPMTAEQLFSLDKGMYYCRMESYIQGNLKE